MIASKADIIAYESLGYSHLVYKGESYFVKLDSESSRLKFKNYLEEKTGKEWGIVELERYVFYRKDMYSLVNHSLRLKNSFRGKVEIPINTISCEHMFMDKNLEGIDLSDFDTSRVKDMSCMFANCTFPEDFSLGDRFNTSKVEDMQYMFHRTKFNKGFSLGDKFDTSSVEDMGYMFDSANLPEDFSLGDRFDTSSVEDMGFMFEKCTFQKGFNLGDKFNTSSVETMQCMFSDTKFNEDFSLARNFTISSRAADMFFNAELPSRVTKQLGSKATAEEIVELLKSASVTKADFF